MDPATWIALGTLLLQGTSAANNAGWFGEEEGPGPGYRPSKFLNQQEPQRRPVRGYEGRNLMDILSLMGRR